MTPGPYTGQLIEELIAIVDRNMPRCGDPLIDLAQVKTILSDKKPMRASDMLGWMVADELQKELMGEPSHEACSEDDLIDCERYVVPPARKLIRIRTDRGRDQLIQPEDLQIKVGPDGFIRAFSDFGPITEKLLPFYAMIDINAGKERP